ncbi:hypothetical protein [Rhizobium jaguaris]|uniref:hypothetical protein n=1 Tax=Rhizobium jaguaris TaxID=1312183 RepID=UPI0013C4BE13|nr:hypothetical protein [Rhizobium jaguaris]
MPIKQIGIMMESTFVLILAFWRNDMMSLAFREELTTACAPQRVRTENCLLWDREHRSKEHPARRRWRCTVKTGRDI